MKRTKEMMKPALEMIRETGGSRTMTLHATYAALVDALGPPNVTDMDDPLKVKASWGFRDPVSGRKGFVWCYRYDRPEDCTCWSADGSPGLLREVFGDGSVER